jgi:hypothetical protein
LKVESRRVDHAKNKMRKGAHGLVSRVDGARVQGWAYDPEDDGSQTVVEFLAGDNAIASQPASLQRLPLIEKGFPPNCGFSVVLPLPPGTHRISARTKRSQFELKNSPFTCTVLPATAILEPEEPKLRDSESLVHPHQAVESVKLAIPADCQPGRSRGR